MFVISALAFAAELSSGVVSDQWQLQRVIGLLCLGTFAGLYLLKQPLAWHFLIFSNVAWMISTLVLNSSIYFAPDNRLRSTLTLAAAAGLLVINYRARGRYMSFVAETSTRPAS